MKSLRKYLKRRRELAGISERKNALEKELSCELGKNVSLVPAAAKGGYDEIFYLQSEHERIAVLRLNSPLKTQDDPIGPDDPGVPLAARDRIEREWSAYQVLAKEGLSPEPLWRSSDAMACSWLPWDRVSRLLAGERDRFWPMMELVFPLIARMHSLGVVHLDLNLGNLLVSPDRSRVMVIDFEFGAVEWVTMAQQKAFDYLRVVDDSVKKRRGGELLKAEPERLIEILELLVDEETRGARLDFVFSKLARLRDEKALCSKLREIFVNLP